MEKKLDPSVWRAECNRDASRGVAYDSLAAQWVRLFSYVLGESLRQRTLLTWLCNSMEEEYSKPKVAQEQSKMHFLSLTNFRK
jgi:hypothetical protein